MWEIQRGLSAGSVSKYHIYIYTSQTRFAIHWDKSISLLITRLHFKGAFWAKLSIVPGLDWTSGALSKQPGKNVKWMGSDVYISVSWKYFHLQRSSTLMMINIPVPSSQSSQWKPRGQQAMQKLLEFTLSAFEIKMLEACSQNHSCCCERQSAPDIHL